MVDISKSGRRQKADDRYLILDIEGQTKFKILKTIVLIQMNDFKSFK
jgi:hypothetical protein